MDVILILLAAGDSRRFHGNKLLHKLGKKPMYRYIVDEIEKLSEVVFVKKAVVTQYHEIADDLSNLGYTAIINSRSDLGISYSIRLGIQEMERYLPDGGAFCFSVCDQPYLDGETLALLVKKWKQSGKGIGALSFGKEAGNPVIFDSRYWKELTLLEGDTGGKRVVKRHPEDVFLHQAGRKEELRDIDERE